MQTRPWLLSHRCRRIAVRALAAVLGLCVAVPAGGCAMPRVSGKSQAEQRASTCETVFEAADAHRTAMDDASSTEVERYRAAGLAAQDWLDVAVQCPQRFSEGVLYSARAQAQAARLATRLDAAYEPLTVDRLDSLETLGIGSEALAYLALAEDRAGFGTEVLAGRYVAGQGSNADTMRMARDGSLLAMSDDHKETASRLVSLAGSDQEDLRQKVYATGDLTGSPNTVVDPTTGLRANTLGVVEMDCVREELNAVAQYGEVSPDLDATARARLTQDLTQLAQLIATHAVTAFDLGYPSTDDALFLER